MTLSQTSRRYIIQWRAFVGPQWARDDAATFWDWSSLNYGEGTPDAISPADTTLFSDVVPAADEAILYADTGFPAAGGCWIGPKDLLEHAGEAWEYVTYTSLTSTTLGGLTRETINSEQTGTHIAGSVVRFWWPLTTDDGQLTFSEELDSNLAALDWRAALRGFVFPQAALRNGHLLYVQRRSVESGAANFGFWTNELVGWLQAPSASEDSSTESQWQVTAVSSGGMLNSIKAQGLRVGPPNTAVGGNASGSAALGAWYKEGQTDEFVGSNIATDPSQAIDNNQQTLYISERFVGTNNDSNGHTGTIDQVHITKYTGQGAGYRWIQLVSWGNPVTFLQIWLLNQDGYAPDVGAARGDSDLPDANDLVILCENRTLFQQENPDCSCTIWEVSDTTCGIAKYEKGDWGGTYEEPPSGDPGGMTVAQWWDTLAPSGGALYVLAKEGGLEKRKRCIAWGTVNHAYLFDSPGEWDPIVDTEWTGDGCTAPTAGQTIRRKWDTSDASSAGWYVDNVSTPGYMIDGDEKLYLLVGTLGMGLTLTNDITSSVPTTAGTLYISLGSAASVDGLTASGTVQIGEEQITYSAKTSANDGLVVTARGANSTTAAAHVAGEVIYQIESTFATDALPLETITLIRTTGLPVPEAFKLYASRNVPQPRTPENDGWEADYVLLATETTNALETYVYDHGVTVPARYRWFLLVVTAMSTDPYRLMLNEFKVNTLGTVYSATTYLATGTVFAAAQAILQGCGIPDGAIVDGGSTPTVTDYTTAPDMVMAVLADLADMTGCLINIGRDSKITIGVHPLVGGIGSETIDWSKTTAAAYAPDWPWGRNVCQVEMEWLSLDGTTSGVTKYPATADAFGDVLRLGPIRTANAAAANAIAGTRYLLARYPFGATIQAAGAPLAARPGVAHGVNWQLGDLMLPMDRSYLIDSTDHRIGDGILTTVVHGLQWGRQDER
jgi:hypothetical protein